MDPRLEDTVSMGSRLPDELIERILHEAWCTLVPPVVSKLARPFDMSVSRYRWTFYASATRTSHLFRRIVIDLPFLHAVFRTPGDAHLYQFITPRVMSQLKGGALDAETVHKELFSRTQVLMDWSGDKSEFGDPFKPPMGPYTLLSGTERRLVPDATRIVCRRWGIGPELQDWMCGLPSLAVVRVLSCDIAPARYRPDHNREIGMPVFRGPKKMQFRHLRAMVELEGAATGTSFSILHNCASTGPLTMLSKQSLKREGDGIPATTTLLVLDTPPGSDGVSDVSKWEIPGGLGAGVLISGIRRKSDQPTIVVKGSKAVEPTSWQLAAEACEKKGVVFKLEVAY